MRIVLMLLPLLELLTLVELGVRAGVVTAFVYVLSTLALGMAIL